MAEQTVTGWCQAGECGRCDGENRSATGWNWWCTHACHSEPKCTDPAHRPALEFWRRHRAAAGA